MVTRFALFLAAGLLIQAGITGRPIQDVIAGIASPNRRRKLEVPDDIEGISSSIGGSSGGTLPNLADLFGGGKGSPKSIIDEIVVPLARKHGMSTGTSPSAISAANARHGATVNGNRSDHQGPPNERWASDMSNGSSPTPQMDALAADLAQTFGLSWNGSGAVSGNWKGYRIQMIYRSNVGGNHFNHVHLGVRK